MTSPRAKIEAQLAAAGRPINWANEQQAAVLSGVSHVTFRQKVKEWEQRGFPQVNPENGKRPIPAILAFWGLPANHSGVLAAVGKIPEDDDGKENWDGRDQSQRIAS